VPVYGDPALGAVLRRVRKSRRLSQERVAELAPCAPSMVSQVETGARVLHAGLAVRLDQVYGTGTMIASLAGSLAYPGELKCATLEEDDDVVLIELPLGGGTMAVSRRALLGALSIGATAGALSDVRNAMIAIPADEELLAEMTHSLRGLQIAERTMPTVKLIDSLVGQVAILDVVRRRAPAHLRRGYVMLAAQYAERLSWMVQESGDLQGAGAWVDRVQVWADQARWSDMVAYAHMRRSMLASTCAEDGSVAVEHAANALRVPGVSARVRGLAAKQAAYGYALLGRPGASRRALEEMVRLFEVTSDQDMDEGTDPIMALRSGLDTASLLAQYQSTCDVYLGGGEHAITLMGTIRFDSGPDRGQTINRARLARAHAQAGCPDQACALALDALSSGQVLDSSAARVEMRRALVPLNRWPGREDVAEVRHRVTTLA
jgi:transcriptional regulator with XRE-family HTH domain